MENIKRSALVPYSAEQMYRLVDDIERYPDFVPYCKKATELERTQDSVSAELEVAKSGIAKSFSTKNHLQLNQKISMELLDGPFKYLKGDWLFIPLSDTACKIELDLAFEFSNRLASLAFTSIFNQLIQSMVAAFTERAEQIYGDSHG